MKVRRVPMYSLYGRLGAQTPTLLFESESAETVKQYLIAELESKHHLSQEQAIALVEYWIPVKWKNGRFIEPKREGNNAIFESQDGQLHYIIITGNSAR